MRRGRRRKARRLARAARLEPELQRAALELDVPELLETPPGDAPRALRVALRRGSYAAAAACLPHCADDALEAAVDANSTSDTYVLITVLFASVLFFAGIATASRVMQARVVLLAIGTVVFIGATIVLSTQPRLF